MLCDLLDKRTSRSSLSRPYKNIDLRKSPNILFFQRGLSIDFFLDKKDQEKVFCSRTILRKQDAVGAYIWASVKKLKGEGGGAEILCVFGGFENSVRSRERA